MYIDRLEMMAFRNFDYGQIDFVYPGKHFASKVKFNNINVILGNNGLGKTTVLKAIALACLGPAISSSGLFPYRLIRQTGDDCKSGFKAKIDAQFIGQKQDKVDYSQPLKTRVEVTKRGDLETLDSKVKDEDLWEPIFNENEAAFFFVGFGATRIVEKAERLDLASRAQSTFLRARRIKSLFEQTYSLVPLNVWLPQVEQSNPKRFEQVIVLINTLINQVDFECKGEIEKGEYLFEKHGTKIPFPALSDGYQAILGWICDLIYNIHQSSNDTDDLVKHSGMVMIDEIDLHLHPKWQMTILPTLAKALPNIQFIVTTHSPLVVGSVEAQNVNVITTKSDGSSQICQLSQPINGLDADQLLLTEYFGLSSTIADDKATQLKVLTEKARLGDVSAAQELLTLMSHAS